MVTAYSLYQGLANGKLGHYREAWLRNSMDLVAHFADKILDKTLKAMVNSGQILTVKLTLVLVHC
jgi:hypothetical protein